MFCGTDLKEFIASVLFPKVFFSCQTVFKLLFFYIQSQKKAEEDKLNEIMAGKVFLKHVTSQRM